LRRYAQDKEDERVRLEREVNPDAIQVPYVKLRHWWYGFGVFLFGNILDFAALGIVPAAIVVLIGSWALVLNVFTASRILGEQKSVQDFVAAGLIITGIIMAVAGRPTVTTLWTTEAMDHCGSKCDSRGLVGRLGEPGAYVAVLVLFVLVGTTITTVSIFGTGQCAVPQDAQTSKDDTKPWVRILCVLPKACYQKPPCTVQHPPEFMGLFLD